MADPVSNVTTDGSTSGPYPVVTDRLTKYYGGKRVVNGLNLTIKEGSVYALLGRNGAGKSRKQNPDARAPSAS